MQADISTTDSVTHPPEASGCPTMDDLPLEGIKLPNKHSFGRGRGRPGLGHRDDIERVVQPTISPNPNPINLMLK